MPIDPLEDFDPRDFDASAPSIGHAAGAQFPSGAGRSLAERLGEVFEKADEIAAATNGLPLTSTVLATPSEKTIATGAITVTQNFHTVDTEGDAASDDLDTVSGTVDGGIYFLRPINTARSVVVKHGTGNIVTLGGADITLAEADDVVVLLDVGSTLIAFAYKTLAAPAQAALVLKTVTELTIATGAVTITQGLHSIDTEADAASDDLDTITGGVAGQFLVIFASNDARSVVVKHNTGNIKCLGGRDITLAEDDDYVLLVRGTTNWTALAFKTEALAGGGVGSALAAVTTGHGASLVGIEDAAGLIAAANVEAALLEIVNRLPTNTIADPGNAGAIPITRSGYCPLVTAGAETRTLAAPSFIGQTLLLYLKTDGGDCVVTCATTVKETGENTITFDNTGEAIKFHAVEEGGNLRWRCAVTDGAGLTTV